MSKREQRERNCAIVSEEEIVAGKSRTLWRSNGTAFSGDITACFVIFQGAKVVDPPLLYLSLSFAIHVSLMETMLEPRFTLVNDPFAPANKFQLPT